jgi:Mg2+ and Co2+ transporter CorA
VPRGYQDAEPDYGETDARLLLFCDAFDRFNELYFRDVNAYYTNREYESDNFERGRLFHAQMLEAYVAFAEAREDFASAFQTQILAMEREGLDELKEQGNLIHYYTRVLISDSRAISDLFYEYEDAGIDFLDVDPERYEPLYAQFKADFEALGVACAADGQLEKEGYTGMRSASLTQYFGTAEQMLVAADDMRNMIAAGSEDIENELTGKFTTGGRNYPMSRFRQRLDMLISEYNNSIS